MRLKTEVCVLVNVYNIFIVLVLLKIWESMWFWDSNTRFWRFSAMWSSVDVVVGGGWIGYMGKGMEKLPSLQPQACILAFPPTLGLFVCCLFSFIFFLGLTRLPLFVPFFEVWWVFSSHSGYTLTPSSKCDNLSDSSHSEISSRSSIVSNGSVDSMSAAGQDERCSSHSLAVPEPTGALEKTDHPSGISDHSQLAHG